MQMARRKIEEIIFRGIFNAYGEIIYKSSRVFRDSVTLSKLENVDYQSNVCFHIGKNIGKSPVEVANCVVKEISDPQILSNVTASSPGFINIRLSDRFIVESLSTTLRSQRLRKKANLTNKSKVLIDFSSPNVGKELHAGHMRSIFCGDTLANIFEFRGYKVDRVSHVGDFGLPVVMLLQECWNTRLALRWLSKTYRIQPDLKTLDKLYISGNRKMNSNANKAIVFRNQVRYMVNRVHRVRRGGVVDDGEVFTTIIDIILTVSTEMHQSLYDRLGVTIIDKPESTYKELLHSVVEELKDSHVTFRSNGALCINVKQNEKGSDPPVLIQKSNGTYLYASVDLAAARFRIVDKKYRKIIYVTDIGQSLHFKQCFSIATLAGWITTLDVPDEAEVNTRMLHVGHGVILGSGGKKLRSRNGESSLIQLIDDAVENASFMMKKNNPSFENDDKTIAESVGISGIRFYDLCAGNRSYTLDFASMLNFKGNTSVYLQYTYSRFYSIYKSSSTELDGDLSLEPNMITEIERDLLFHLSRFDEVIDTTIEALSPNILCEYIISVARSANLFYEASRIIGSKDEYSRLQICYAILKIMETSMDLLGVRTLRRM
eukprot:g6524.t1